MAKRDLILPSDVIESLGESLKVASPSPPPDTSKLGPEPSIPINDTYSGSLDDAASLLLRQLVPSIRDYAFEVADLVLKIPRWQLVLGTFMTQYESGNLPSPSIDPSWRKAEVASFRSVCNWCKEEFTPRRYGQLFCEGKKPRCGDLARQDEINKHNKMKAKELEVRKKIERIEMGLQP